MTSNGIFPAEIFAENGHPEAWQTLMRIVSIGEKKKRESERDFFCWRGGEVASLPDKLTFVDVLSEKNGQLRIADRKSDFSHERTLLAHMGEHVILLC